MTQWRTASSGTRSATSREPRRDSARVAKLGGEIQKNYIVLNEEMRTVRRWTASLDTGACAPPCNICIHITVGRETVTLTHNVTTLKIHWNKTLVPWCLSCVNRPAHFLDFLFLRRLIPALRPACSLTRPTASILILFIVFDGLCLYDLGCQVTRKNSPIYHLL